MKFNAQLKILAGSLSLSIGAGLCYKPAVNLLAVFSKFYAYDVTNKANTLSVQLSLGIFLIIIGVVILTKGIIEYFVRAKYQRDQV